MSDSSVKAGVEDVLSSIKRLVREEGRKIITERQRPAPQKPARLVLTDALRVAELTESERNESLRTLARDFSVDAFWINEAEFSHNEPANDEVKPMVLKASDRVFSDEPLSEAEALSSYTVDSGGRESEPSRTSGDLAGSLSAKIEALEAAIARTEDQWEPDGNSDDEYAGTQTRRISWDNGPNIAVSSVTEASEGVTSGEVPEFDQSSAATTATFVRACRNTEVQHKGPEPAAEQMATATLGEEELRALVTDIVQQELQGALGERITRNIRKLVRREINRALAAQNLN